MKKRRTVPMFDPLKYDSFEVHPVQAIDGQGGVIPISQFAGVPVALVLEECEPDAVDIYSWGVYGHIPHNNAAYKPPFTEKDEGGIFCLADCPDRETAEFIQRLLLKAIGIVFET
jgi:hypothetical protein